MRTQIIPITLAIFVLSVCLCRAGEDSKAAIKKRSEARHKELVKHKKAGKIGETSLGYVEAVKEEVLKDKKLKKLLDAENADRGKLYKLVAKEQSTPKVKVSPKQVGKHNAIIKFKNAGPEEYFKAKDGKWRKKKEMLKKAKEG